MNKAIAKYPHLIETLNMVGLRATAEAMFIKDETLTIINYMSLTDYDEQFERLTVSTIRG